MGSLVSRPIPSAEFPLTDGNLDTKHVHYPLWYDGMWYGMAATAFVLLLLCALLAGLTLAVCGLEVTLLQMRVVTGTPKQRYEPLLLLAQYCDKN
jgi:cell division protein FtsX